MVYGGTKSGCQIVQFIISNDSAAGLDPADYFLCDVQPNNLKFMGKLFLWQICPQPLLPDFLSRDVAPAFWFVYFRRARLLLR